MSNGLKVRLVRLELQQGGRHATLADLLRSLDAEADDLELANLGGPLVELLASIGEETTDAG